MLLAVLWQENKLSKPGFVLVCAAYSVSYKAVCFLAAGVVVVAEYGRRLLLLYNPDPRSIEWCHCHL